jgi:hypothetical protein
LGEEQAYQQGRVDGRRDAIESLGGAFEKVLAPDSLESLAKALLDGLAKNPPATVESSGEKIDPTDPTEPANWPNGAGVVRGLDMGAPGGDRSVYAVAGCIFHYCPTPERCKALAGGCATAKPASGGVP